MKFREAMNRHIGGNLVGMKVVVPNGRGALSGKTMHFRQWSGNTAVWLSEGMTGSQNIEIVMEGTDLLEWEVPDQEDLLLDGDQVYVDGSRNGLGENEIATVTRVEEGDWAVCPVQVRFKGGQMAQYKMAELHAVMKN